MGRRRPAPKRTAPKRKLHLDDLPFDKLSIDIPVDRDLVNDPPFLRYLLRKTFAMLPKELAEVPWAAKRSELVKHLGLVHMVFDEEIKREYATFEDPDEEDEEGGEDEEYEGEEEDDEEGDLEEEEEEEEEDEEDEG